MKSTAENRPPGFAELQQLGLTEIEALCYIALLQMPGATGYRLDKKIGKPTPNVYKALRSLLEKGAVVADEGGSSTAWHAIPIEEVVEVSRARHERIAQAAVASLKPLEAALPDDQLVRIGNLDQALERARRMLGRAESIALLDAFPVLLEPLVGALEEAAAGDMRVVAKTYRDQAIEGIETLTAPDADHVLQTWPGAQLTLVVDGKELLFVMTDRESRKLHRALWSDSVFLACLVHNSVAAEIDLTWFERAHHRLFPDEPAGVPDIHLTRGNIPGFAELTRRNRRHDPPDEP